MKKLMIAVAMIVTAGMANAATYSWQCSGKFFDGTGETTTLAGQTVYLMFESAYSRSDLVSAFNNGNINWKNAVSSLTLGSDGKFSAAGSASYDTTVAQTAYLAILDDDRLFISTTANASYQATSTSVITFDSQAVLSRYNNTTKTLLDDYQAKAGFSSAGWYSAENIPEPTSGLLLVLGVAGLALRRRRA